MQLYRKTENGKGGKTDKGNKRIGNGNGFFMRILGPQLLFLQIFALFRDKPLYCEKNPVQRFRKGKSQALILLLSLCFKIDSV